MICVIFVEKIDYSWSMKMIVFEYFKVNYKYLRKFGNYRVGLVIRAIKAVGFALFMWNCL